MELEEYKTNIFNALQGDFEKFKKFVNDLNNEELKEIREVIQSLVNGKNIWFFVGAGVGMNILSGVYKHDDVANNFLLNEDDRRIYCGGLITLLKKSDLNKEAFKELFDNKNESHVKESYVKVRGKLNECELIIVGSKFKLLPFLLGYIVMLLKENKSSSIVSKVITTNYTADIDFSFYLFNQSIENYVEMHKVHGHFDPCSNSGSEFIVTLDHDVVSNELACSNNNKEKNQITKDTEKNIKIIKRYNDALSYELKDAPNFIIFFAYSFSDSTIRNCLKEIGKREDKPYLVIVTHASEPKIADIRDSGKNRKVHKKAGLHDIINNLKDIYGKDKVITFSINRKTPIIRNYRNFGLVGIVPIFAIKRAWRGYIRKRINFLKVTKSH